MSKNTTLKNKNQSGNAIVIVLVILVIAAIGALGYLSTQMKDGGQTAAAPQDVAAAETTEQSATEKTADNSELTVPPAQSAAAEENKQPEIKPGNPVVAKLGKTDITRQDVLESVQNFPPQMRQLPLNQLFPLAVDQVLNAKIIEKKTEGVNLDSDPEVKKQLAAAKDQIVRTVYLQKQISKNLTDDRVKKAYDEYVATFEKVEEVKAAHILVEDEATAKEVVTKLIETGDFAGLAKEYSKDSTAENGGTLGYFTKTDVVKEFGDSAFSMEPGTYTKDPVKSEFGYHIIQVQDKRLREPAPMEEVKPFLEADLRRVVLEEIIAGWRDAETIERFDINGDAIEPAAGSAE